jgi:NAD(P)-dependent dehydrogenase (short-subunit alcohol dehydrogenase family)
MARRILILGASSTLGLAVAQVLGAEGNQLWLTSRDPQKMADMSRQFVTARVDKFDALVPEDARGLRTEIQRGWGGLDGLVCAFGSGALKPVHMWSDQAAAEMMNLNVQALVRLGREFLPLLLKGDQPSVVLISSIMGVVGAAGMSVYGASKAAVASLARSWAIEWAPRRIRVNAVAPGMVPSPMSDTILGSLSPAQVAAVQGRHPLGFGESKDVAYAVVFLLGPEAKWITGVVLPVDGGYSAQ